MSDWRANPSLEVFTDRVHELNILAQAVAGVERGWPQPNPAAGVSASPTEIQHPRGS